MSDPPRFRPPPPDPITGGGLVTDRPGSHTWWCHQCRRWTMPSRRHPAAPDDSCDQCEGPRAQAA